MPKIDVKKDYPELIVSKYIANARGINGFVEFAKAEIEQSIPNRFEHQAGRYPDRLAIKTRCY